jgi:hypothetical protein
LCKEEPLIGAIGLWCVSSGRCLQPNIEVIANSVVLLREERRNRRQA